MSGTACTRACGYCGACTSAWERDDDHDTPTTSERPSVDYFGLALAQARAYRDQVQRGERVAPVVAEDPPF